MKSLSMIAAILLASCATEQPPVLDAAGPADPHERTVLALAEGVRALGRSDAGALDAAQRALVTSGARPETGEPDLAFAWHSKAERIAGKPFPAPPPVRGRVLGSAYKSATVASGGGLTLEQIFMAGQKARVSVVPAAKADVTLRVSEGSDAPICAKAANGAPASCAWLPTWTARYRIEILNRSARPTPVYIVIN